MSSFLSHFFAEYVDYGFTAELEDALDDVANGEKRWRDTLADFWGPFQGDVESIKGVRTSLVVDVLDATLGVHFFGDDEAALEHQMRAIQEATEKAARDHDPDSPYPALAFDPETLSERRKCPSCAGGRLGLKLSRTGGFIGCSNYPACGYARSLVASADGDEGSGVSMDFPATLGADPISGRRVSIRNGPYGPYLELEVETPSAEAEAAARAAREMQDAVELARLEEEARARSRGGVRGGGGRGGGERREAASAQETEKGETPETPEIGERVEAAPVRAAEPRDRARARDAGPGAGSTGVPEDAGRAPRGWRAGGDERGALRLVRQPRRRQRVAAEEAPARGAAPRGSAGARGEAGTGPEPSGADAVDEADARAWARAATEEAEAEEEEEEGEEGGKAAFAEEAECRDANAEPSGNDGDDEGAAAALRASFGPVSLAVALEVLAARSKPAGAGRGRWGRKKKAAEDGKNTSAESPSGSSTEAPAKTTSAAEKSAPPKKKRAPSSYMLYCAEARASLPEGLKVPEQAKLLGASWKALSEEERSRFTAAAAAAKATLASEAGVSEPKKTKKRAPSAYAPVLRGGARVVTRGAEGDGTGEAARHGVEEPRGFRAVQVRTRGGGGERGGEGVNANDATLYEYP